MNSVENRCNAPLARDEVHDRSNVEAKDSKKERTSPRNWAWGNKYPHYDWMDSHALSVPTEF